MKQQQFEAPVRSFQVKNTFIDVEESPKDNTWAETARRARSMPPPPTFDTCSEEEDESRDSRESHEDEVSSPLSLRGTHYSESPRPTQDRHMFPSRLASWPFIPDNMMVLLPCPPTPTEVKRNDVEKVSDISDLNEKKKLTCDFDSQSGTYRVIWYVDARKLDSNDKQAVSPSFEMSWKGEAKTFKVMLFPEAAPGVRGAYNFKKSRGRGYIRLKCEDEVSHPTFATLRLSIGEESRGPVKHDFAHSVSCGLPKRQAVWDCKKLCEDTRLMLLVTLDIVPTYDHRELA